MKLQTLFLYALASFTLPLYAQDFLLQFPQCALNCSAQVIANVPCSSTDKSCLCKDPQNLLANIIDCASAHCNLTDIRSSTNSTLSFCDAPQRDDSLVLEVTQGVFTGLAILFVCLRIITRFPPFQVAFGWDDGLIISALIISTIDAGMRYFSTANGFGKDIWTIPQNTVTLLYKLFVVGGCFYDFGIAVTKLSILAFYLRIFTSLTFRKATFILMAICTVYLIVTTFLMIFQCTPVSYQWTVWTGEVTGKCLDISLLAWVFAATNIALDIAVMVLPFPHILKLNLGRKKKVQIGAMFLVGLFVTIASIVRLRSLVKFRATTNFTFDYVEVVYFSLIEVNVGIICASLPAIQLLLRRVAPRLFGSTIDSASYINQHSAATSRAFRNTGTHLAAQRSQITKTITTTVTVHAKDSDSVIELVGNVRRDGEGASFASTDP